MNHVKYNPRIKVIEDLYSGTTVALVPAARGVRFVGGPV